MENENLFKKLEFHFLVESIKIENGSFLYKIGISEVNVKINNMVSTKWIYYKERSFASNYFIFLNILFQFKNHLYRDDLMYQRPECPNSYFCKGWSFIWRYVFPVSILNIIRKKADYNFCSNMLENHFRHLKLYSDPASWLTRSVCHMCTFWKTKYWSSHFWQVLLRWSSPPRKT